MFVTKGLLLFSGLSTALKMAAVGIVVAPMVFGAGYIYGKRSADAQAELRGAKATIERFKQRGLIDEAVSNLDDCALLADLGVSDCQ